MASVFFKFNYTKEDNKELNEIKTIIVPQLNVVDKIVDGGETTFFVKNLGSGANYDKVVSLGGITSLEMLYPQGTWTGNTWGELLRVTITSYNGKRLNTANVRHINPHDICSIRTEKGETTITTNNRVSAGQYNGFEIYKTASTINDMGTIINALPTQSGGILDAPTDGRTYGRKDSNWQVITDSDLDKYLISGGASWSGTGLVYDVSGLEYYFNGDKLAAATQITLDASDPDYNRLDAIVVDEAGVVSVIKGDASASPISPSVDESHILVQYILVEAGTTEPTIAKEDIYLENAEWTTSTYTTGTATGSIDFDNAVSPKQGVKCISANADARLGARFVRTTSFDPYQYTMLSMWVRFTGSNVATNKSLNVRFENGAGALVANTINLFNFGLQRNLLNVWQLVVIPITSFGVLPTTVKGLKIIMAGGTIGQPRQWDIDLISLTDNSVPSINEQVFNVLKDGALVGQSSTINFKGAPVTVTNDPINKKIDVEFADGGSQIAFTKTKAEIDALIAGNNLVKNALYEITGVHPTLYDDGTTSGTTVYLRAISGSELEVQGMGKFYNPKYDQSIDGFGIWDNKMYGTFSNIVGNFDYQNKETVTANNSATGILLADGMIQWVSGDWSAATSILGDVSGATADVTGFITPTYGIGDKVIWGGYSWTNTTGNIGSSVDVLNLDSEWIKDVYDLTNYNLAYDVIEYDYANDWISRRYEVMSNVDVKITKSSYTNFADNYGLIYSSISVQQFGNPFDCNTGKGILNKSINNAYDESINFSGSFQQNLNFGQSSNQYNLTFGQSSFQYNLTFGQSSNQQNLTFGQSSFQYNLTFGQSSYQQNLTFGQSSFQYNLTFGQSSNQQNLTFGQSSNQQNLTFGAGSQVDFNSQILNSNMEYVDFKTKYFTVPDLSSATYIFDGNIKEVYQRPDGALKIKFMNDTDTLQVENIDA